MEALKKIIKEYKPTITESTLKTYSSIIHSFYYKYHKTTEEFKPSWFDNQKKILVLIEDMNMNSRKTLLAGLLCIVKENDEYKKRMMEDIHKKKDEEHEQKMTPKQKENWLDYDVVMEYFDREYQKCKPLLESKSSHLTTKEMQKLTAFIMLCLTTGKYIPPRRNMDYNNLKYKNYDEEKDNYLHIDTDKSIYQLVFNKYKTANTYHKQIIEIPTALRAILLDYIRHKRAADTSDYLLSKKNGSLYQNNDIGKVLETFFDRKIGTSMLRHIYLSNLYKDIPALSQMEETAREMGHSVGQALEYIKK